MRFVGRGARFVTKGDANSQVERWNVARDGRLARVLYGVPEIGRVALGVQTPAIRLFLLVFPAFLLALWLIVEIWRRVGRPPSDEVVEPA